MPDKVTITKAKLDSLANTVASKTGAELPLTIDEMKSEIAGMSGGSSTNSPTYYGTCSTASGTAQKEVTISDVTELTTGLAIRVKFDNENTASNPTLKLNTFSAVAIYTSSSTAGDTAATSWAAGSVVTLTYDGSHWVINNFNNTTYNTISNYGTCDTAAATAQKEVTISGITELTEGLAIRVKFTYGNSVVSPTLQLNSFTAIGIYRSSTAAGGSSALSWLAGSVVTLTYDGSHWVINNYNNTTYDSMTEAELEAGTGTSVRVITPARLKQAIEHHGIAKPATAGTAGQVLGLDSNLDPAWVNQQGGGSSTNSPTYYGTCDTAAATVQKEVTIAGITELTTGLAIRVKFSNSNSVADPTLKLNTFAAAAIYRSVSAAGDSSGTSWLAGSVVTLTYDGSHWVITSFNNTTYSSMTVAEMQNGTGTGGRVITATRLKSAIEYHGIAKPATAGTAGQVLGLDSNLAPVWINQQGGGGGSDPALTTDMEWTDVYGEWAAGYFYDPDNSYAYTQISASDTIWGSQAARTNVSCTPYANMIPVESGEQYRYLSPPVHLDSKNAEVPSIIIFDSSKNEVMAYTRTYQDSYTEFTIPSNGAWMAVLYYNDQEYTFQKKETAEDRHEILANVYANYRTYINTVPPKVNTLAKGYICMGTDDLRRSETKGLHELYTAANIPYYIAAIPDAAKGCIPDDPYKTNLDYMRLCVAAGGEIICHSAEQITSTNVNDYDFINKYFRGNKKELEAYGFTVNGIFKAGGEGYIYGRDERIDAWAMQYYKHGDLFGYAYPYLKDREILEYIGTSTIDDIVEEVCVNHGFAIITTHDLSDSATQYAYLMQKLGQYTRGTDYEFVTPSQLYDLLMPTPPVSGDSSGAVQDVQVNGSSVVNGQGIANVNISGKIDKPSNPATGSFLVYNGSAWVAQTLTTWQGGNY